MEEVHPAGLNGQDQYQADKGQYHLFFAFHIRARLVVQGTMRMAFEESFRVFAWEGGNGYIGGSRD